LAALTALDMPHFGQFHDDSVYWVCAKSLAEGTGYRIMSLPEQPYQTKYPPLFAWVLSFVWRINPHFPENLPLAMLLCWLTLPAYVALSYRLFRQMEFTAARAWVLCVVLAFNPYVVLLSISLMSEPLFTCLVLAALLLNRGPAAGPPSRWRQLGAGLAAGGAYLARTSGIALLSLPLLHLIRKQRARAVWFGAGMLPAVAGWMWWSRAHPPAGSDLVSLYYTDYVRFHLANFSWGDLPLLLWKNLSGLWLGTGGFFLFGLEDVFWANLFRGVIAALALAGLIRLLRAGRAADYACFAAAYLGLLLFWHVEAGDWLERLLYPLAPLIAGSVLEALIPLVRWTFGLLRAPAVVPMLGGGMLAGGLVCAATVFAVSNLGTLRAMPGLLEGFRQKLDHRRQVYRWIAEHLPPDATLLTIHEEALTYLYANRMGVTLITPPRLLYYADEEGVRNLWGSFVTTMRAHKIRYLLIHTEPANPRRLDGRGQNHLLKVLAGSREVHLVHAAGRTAIYGLDK
jgi:hypothetical protein